MRRARQFTDSGEHDERKQESQGRGCCAVGCPNAGTISDSTKGGPFRCWAHDRMSDGAYWGLLTKGIEENIWIFKVANRVAHLPLYELEEKAYEIDNYLASQNRTDLRRKEGETCPDWIGRLRHAAFEAASSEAKARGWKGVHQQ